MSALSALAERPALIKRLFQGNELDEDGLYYVWVFTNGTWKQITLDDMYFCDPTEEGKFAFGDTEGGDIWVNMLEKAYAKVIDRSYAAIEDGDAVEALHDLTGAPVEDIHFKNLSEAEVERTFRKVRRADDLGYVMVSKTLKNFGDEEDFASGLIPDHCYSLLNAAEAKGSDGEVHRVVQLRNPQGQGGEWTGDWADDSDLWTPQAKRQLKFVEEDDGVFWMGWDDFVSHFRNVGICKVHRDYIWNYLELESKVSQRTAVHTVGISVITPGNYFFTIDQADLRTNEVEYAKVRLTVAKLENGVHFCACAYGEGKSISVNFEGTAGSVYVALIELEANDQEIPNIVFGSYGVGVAGVLALPLARWEWELLQYATFQSFATKNIGTWMKERELFKVTEGQFFAGLQREFSDRRADFGLVIYRYKLIQSNTRPAFALALSSDNPGQPSREVIMTSNTFEIGLEKTSCGTNLPIRLEFFAQKLQKTPDIVLIINKIKQANHYIPLVYAKGKHGEAILQIRNDKVVGIQQPNGGRAVAVAAGGQQKVAASNSQQSTVNVTQNKQVNVNVNQNKQVNVNVNQSKQVNMNVQQNFQQNVNVEHHVEEHVEHHVEHHFNVQQGGQFQKGLQMGMQGGQMVVGTGQGLHGLRGALPQVQPPNQRLGGMPQVQPPNQRLPGMPQGGQMNQRPPGMQGAQGQFQYEYSYEYEYKIEGGAQQQQMGGQGNFRGPQGGPGIGPGNFEQDFY